MRLADEKLPHLLAIRLIVSVGNGTPCFATLL